MAKEEDFKELREGLEKATSSISKLDITAAELTLTCRNLSDTMREIQQNQSQIEGCRLEMQHLREDLRELKTENTSSHDAIFKSLRAFDGLRIGDRIKSLEGNQKWFVSTLIILSLTCIFALVKG